MDAWAIVVAGGSGRRFGRAKQFELLGEGRVLDAAVAVARQACAGVVVVVPAESLEEPVPGADAVVAGGPTRSASVRSGLAAVPDAAGIIVVHDAARPLARAELWRSVIAAVEQGAEAAIPVIPVADTVKRVADDRVVETVDRRDLVTVQTPQGFKASVLRQAHVGGAEATDDAALVEELGATVVLVPGAPDNLKVTSPSDLTVARALLAARGEP